MTPAAFNGRFRPLVGKAWGVYSTLARVPANDKTAREQWYRNTLVQVVHQDTTKGLDDAAQHAVLKAFAAIAESAHEVPLMHGWTENQNEVFQELVLEAWDKSGGMVDAAFRHWFDTQLAEAGIESKKGDGKTWRTEAFDRVMAHFACLAGNEYWISRTATQAEIRMRHLIRLRLKDLEALTGEPHHWSYVRSIWKQSNLLPDLDDAPADILHKVACMLDTHVRRVAEKLGEDLNALPSRKAAAMVPETV